MIGKPKVQFDQGFLTEEVKGHLCPEDNGSRGRCSGIDGMAG